MKLITRVEKHSTQQVFEYLQQLRDNEPDQLEIELRECNRDGLTPLCLAISHSNLEMVRLLFDFGAARTVQPTDKSVENYAYKVAQMNDFRQKQCDVYALVKTRTELHHMTWRDFRTPFSEMLHLIIAANRTIQKAQGKAAILFFGLTGVGKSTLINFLCGVDYKQALVRGQKRVNPLQKEWVRTSSETSSATAFPEVVEPRGISLALVDLPGFEDTRGTMEEICAAASISSLSQQLEGIQELWFITTWSALADSHMSPYRVAAQHIGAILGQNAGVSNRLTLVITQGDDDLTVEDVRARLETLCEDEGWDTVLEKAPGIRPSEEKQLRGDITKKQCIKRVTQAILTRENSILLIDVTRPQMRAIVHHYLSRLSTKPEKATAFNFQNYSSHVQRFQHVLQKIIQYFSAINQTQHCLFDNARLLSQKIQEKQAALKQLRAEYTLLKNTDVFEEGPYLERIKTAEQTIQKLQARQIQLNHSKKQAEEQISQKREQHLLDISKLQKCVDQLEWQQAHARQLKSQTDEAAGNFLYSFMVTYKKQPQQVVNKKEQLIREGESHNQSQAQRQENLNEITRDLAKQRVLLARCQDNFKSAIQPSEQSIHKLQDQLWEMDEQIREQRNTLDEYRQQLQHAKERHASKTVISQEKLKDLEERNAKLTKELENLLEQQRNLEVNISLSNAEQSVNAQLLDLVLQVNNIFKSRETNHSQVDEDIENPSYTILQ